MDPRRDWYSGSQVEFIDGDDVLEPTAAAGLPTRFARLASACRQRWFAPAVSGAMLVAAVAIMVGVLRTQTSFPLFTGGPGGALRYALDGLGHYHSIGRPSAGFETVIGHGPALGAVAIAGGVVLAVTAFSILREVRHTALGASRPFVTLASCATACLAAGAIAASLICEALEISQFPRHTWARGFWLFALGTALAVVAAVVNVVRIGVDSWSPGLTRSVDGVH